MRLAIIGSRSCTPIDIEKELDHIPDTIVRGCGFIPGVKRERRLIRELRNIKGTSLLFI